MVVRKAGAKPVQYRKIKMKVVLITAVWMGGSAGVDRLTENSTVNFPKVSLDYVPQDDKGAPWDNDTDDFEMNELKNSCTQVLKNARLLRCERRREAVGSS